LWIVVYWRRVKTKMDTDEKVSAQPGSLPPMSAAAGGGAFATINVSPFLW
jgi:hypothetical protein